MSVRVICKGNIDLEVSTTSAWVKMPQTDQALIVKFGPVMTGDIDLTAGDKLPVHLALFSVLRDAWLNHRKVEVYFNLAAVLDMQSVPPGQPAPIVENFPYTFPRYQCVWGCERVIARDTV